ncbi:MAG: DUF2071 domain-containing protein [Haloarculaceae archaeon]
MPDFEMEWRDALFASWPVDPGLLAPRLPDRLTVDTFEGDAYLSVVPFAIRDIRPEGLPAAVGLSTPELNLRTYVCCDDAPGVYFFSLDAGDLLGVVGARLFNHLPYYWADVDYEPDGPAGRSRFASRRRTPGARAARFDATYSPDGERFQPEPDSLDHFLVERYRYFAEGPDGGIRYSPIEHDPWQLRPATWTVRENTLFRTNGFDAPAGEPHLVYGDPLEVWAGATERWE